jgi:hypothetical protein
MIMNFIVVSRFVGAPSSARVLRNGGSVAMWHRVARVVLFDWTIGPEICMASRKQRSGSTPNLLFPSIACCIRVMQRTQVLYPPGTG